METLRTGSLFRNLNYCADASHGDMELLAPICVSVLRLLLQKKLIVALCSIRLEEELYSSTNLFSSVTNYITELSSQLLFADIKQQWWCGDAGSSLFPLPVPPLRTGPQEASEGASQLCP